MATLKGKVTADSIRYYKGGEKVLVKFDEVAEFDNEEIYNYYLQTGMIVIIKEKKASKKTEDADQG